MLRPLEVTKMNQENWDDFQDTLITHIFYDFICKTLYRNGK